MQTSIRIVVTLLALFGFATAQAQVQLENTIKKVETFLDGEGQIKRRMVDAVSIVPGDELQYQVRFSNQGEQQVDAGTIVITDVIPEHTLYVQGTAYGSGTDIQFSIDGEQFGNPQDLVVAQEGAELVASPASYEAIKWTFGPALAPGASSYVSFNVRLK